MWRANTILRRLTVCLFCCCLASCEIEGLYGVELAGAPDNTGRRNIQKDGYTLFLVSSNHTEVPGFYVVAQATEVPDPRWHWDEFQYWPAEKKMQAYGQYFDQLFLDVSVRFQSECPYQVVSVDHRESALEGFLGRGLTERDLRDLIRGPVKGLFIQIPVSDCAYLLDEPETSLEKISIVVARENNESDDETEIRFRLSVLGTWLQTKYFGSWFSSL